MVSVETERGDQVMSENGIRFAEPEDQVLVTLDPGKTTGYSIWEGTTLVEAGGLHKMEEVVKFFHRLPAFGVTVVYEGFARANASTSDQLEPIEICGAIQAMCIHYGYICEKQYPPVLKGYIEYAKEEVKAVNVPTNEKVHAIDAIAHALRHRHKTLKNWSPHEYRAKHGGEKNA